MQYNHNDNNNNNNNHNDISPTCDGSCCMGTERRRIDKEVGVDVVVDEGRPNSAIRLSEGRRELLSLWVGVVVVGVVVVVLGVVV